MTAVAQWYTPGGIRPGIRSDSDISFGDTRNFWRARISLTPPALLSGGQDVKTS